MDQQMSIPHHFGPKPLTFQETRVCCLLLNIVIIQDESRTAIHWRTRGKTQGNLEVFCHFLSNWLRAVCVAISKSSMSQNAIHSNSFPKSYKKHTCGHVAVEIMRCFWLLSISPCLSLFLCEHKERKQKKSAPVWCTSVSALHQVAPATAELSYSIQTQLSSIRRIDVFCLVAESK